MKDKSKFAKGQILSLANGKDIVIEDSVWDQGRVFIKNSEGDIFRKIKKGFVRIPTHSPSWKIKQQLFINKVVRLTPLQKEFLEKDDNSPQQKVEVLLMAIITDFETKGRAPTILSVRRELYKNESIPFDLIYGGEFGKIILDRLIDDYIKDAWEQKLYSNNGAKIFLDNHYNYSQPKMSDRQINITFGEVQRDLEVLEITNNDKEL